MGALIMRLTMIFIGAALIQRFEWIIYIFGAFLVYTGIKMFKQEELEIQPEENPVVKFVTRFIPITRHYDEQKFFTRVNGRLMGTLLFMVLVIVEVTDLVFAVDSIPAIFVITTNPFIVYTSNVFAILGLQINVLPAGRRGGEVSIPQDGTGDRADLYRSQDAGRSPGLAYSDLALAYSSWLSCWSALLSLRCSGPKTARWILMWTSRKDSTPLLKMSNSRVPNRRKPAKKPAETPEEEPESVERH